jgi:hypothetical protein
MMSPICSLLRTVLIVTSAVLRSSRHRMLDLLLLLRVYYTRLDPLLVHSTNVHAAQNHTNSILVLARRKTTNGVRAYRMAEILHCEILILQGSLMHQTRAETDQIEHSYGKRRRAMRSGAYQTTEPGFLWRSQFGLQVNEGLAGGT